MIQYLVEQIFDILFQYFVNQLSENAQINNTQNVLQSEDLSTHEDILQNEAHILPSNELLMSPNNRSDTEEKTILVCYMDPEKKRMVNFDMTVKVSMKVEDVKRELQGKINSNVEHWSNLAILFMGQELPNQLELSGCDLGDHSTLHALDLLKARRDKPLKVLAEAATQPNKLPSKLTGIKEEITIIDHYQPSSSKQETKGKLYFFIYCEICDAIRNGKLRVACSKCGHGSILFKNEPQSWTDVLTPDRIESKCYAPDCTGDRARFYFKCIDEHQHREPKDPSTATPLNRMRRNNINVACLACMDSTVDVVLVFPCDHVICIECFRDFCKTALSERNLSWSESSGFTVSCPIDCEHSLIEAVHLNLLDDHFYSLYRKFASEELVIKNGGILCPYSECDQPYYPPTMPPPACEVTECAKCRLVYCVLCTYEGQYAPVNCPFESLIEQTNSEIRQNAKKTEPDTKLHSTYLSALIEKFSLLRQRLTGSNEQNVPRWQDTMSRMKIREIAKPCPKCRTPTERNGGCMHMVCTRRKCNFNWCWICLTEWNNDCMSTHWFG